MSGVTLEVRFDSLVAELNYAYRRITQDTEGGMRFLYEHLHCISIQASQFSGMVHQQITKMVEGMQRLLLYKPPTKATTTIWKLLHR